jgi:hypothetical protein
MPHVDARVANALASPFQQGDLQFAPVDADLWPAVSGRGAARFVPDVLAAACEKGLLLHRNAKVEQALHGAEFIEASDAVRLKIDSDAKRPDFPYALENLDLDARAEKLHRGDKTTYAAANDQRLHVSSMRV